MRRCPTARCVRLRASARARVCFELRKWQTRTASDPQPNTHADLSIRSRMPLVLNTRFFDLFVILTFIIILFKFALFWPLFQPNSCVHVSYSKQFTHIFYCGVEFIMGLDCQYKQMPYRRIFFLFSFWMRLVSSHKYPSSVP